ncbi:hypothetical protein GCM10027061_24130 [Nesterenkonia suensis]
MARRRIPPEAGRAAVEQWIREQHAGQHAGQQAEQDEGVRAPAAPDPSTRRTAATAVRFLLEELAERAPGNSVEVRVPPFGVTQCVAGPAHTRGTPSNVVELSPQTWLMLATGRLSWAEAVAAGAISASGTRADLREELPLI